MAEFGRRAGLRILWGNSREGSNPSPCTIKSDLSEMAGLLRMEGDINARTWHNIDGFSGILGLD